MLFMNNYECSVLIRCSGCFLGYLLMLHQLLRLYIIYNRMRQRSVVVAHLKRPSCNLLGETEEATRNLNHIADVKVEIQTGYESRSLTTPPSVSC